MYAMAKGQTKDMNNGIVKFNFKHILSQVVFKAKTQYDNMQVDINMIKIHNVKMRRSSHCLRQPMEREVGVILLIYQVKYQVWQIYRSERRKHHGQK